MKNTLPRLLPYILILTILLAMTLLVRFLFSNGSGIGSTPESGHHAGDAYAPGPLPETYEERIGMVRQTPGLVAFWDFANREDGLQGSGRFRAYTATEDTSRYILESKNISREFWKDGDEATLTDFPLLGRGPFGQSVRFSRPRAQNDLPVLMVPRKALHDSPLDIKGPGSSVSMVVWMTYQEGAHAIAGMWHEGTDSPPIDIPAEVQVRGRRQFGMFAGLQANPGASSAHISENGLASFGDTYARHLAVTPEKMRRVSLEPSDEELDEGWSVAGFTFDHEAGTVTAYLDGVATEWWIEDPAQNRFYHPTANAWRQAKLAKMEGIQKGEDSDFPRDQFYEPPENEPFFEEVLSEDPEERTILRTYEFTKIKMVQRRDADGRFQDSEKFELVALKANPYWFGRDIYSPPSVEEGGPFTIGRVIHSNRHPTLTTWIGGVAVFDRALSDREMQNLARIGREGSSPVIKFDHIDIRN